MINYEKENDYILNWSEFEFYPGVTEAISLLSEKFATIVVISNQRGVGRGLMTEKDLLRHSATNEIRDRERWRTY